MNTSSVDSNRRLLLEGMAAVGFSGSFHGLAEAKGSAVNDVSQLNRVVVAEESRPGSTAEIVRILRNWSGIVSVGGGRYSMGGQIAAPNSMHLDMRAMNRVVFFDAERRIIRVQSGIRWRDIQDVIDPHDLSIKIMQSYSNFTVGGSVSVNCHGRYVDRGPLINSVRALQLVTADASVLELTRSQQPELFAAVFGGYGGLGVITEVELELDQNVRMERVTQSINLRDYPQFFREQILSDRRVILHNADLSPPDFDVPQVVSWIQTEKPVTQVSRLVPRNLDYNLEKNAIWAITELPGGNELRSAINRSLHDRPEIVWRNHEASLDTASLEPRTRSMSTYLLQEYFVPIPQFLSFVRAMASILRAHRVNALNISIRHSPADIESLMRWAPTEVFAFVLYYKQRNSRQASVEVRAWTQELIDAALNHGGRYYLPYRPDATQAQFHRAYPEAKKFKAIKYGIDPMNRFRNQFLDHYL